MLEPKIWIGFVFVLIGWFLITYCLVGVGKYFFLIQFGQKTKGKVKSFLMKGRDKYGLENKSLQVEVIIEGNLIEFETKLFWVRPPFSIGSEVPVIYTKKKDQGWNVSFDSWEEALADPIISGVIGLVMFILGISFLVSKY